MGRKSLLPKQFLKYVTQPVSLEDMNIWVKGNNINIEKTELFYDYISSLHLLIEGTYLGSDVIKEDKDRLGHFNWCWDNILHDLKKENINFELEGTHHEYFWNFFYESFYIHQNNQEQSDKIKDFLEVLFLIHIPKTKSELDMLSEIYIVLNDNLTVKQ
tara:strand:- start:649 stop:1125 length:477 start_codon:yes stop_codon:yes gene_type:complete